MWWRGGRSERWPRELGLSWPTVKKYLAQAAPVRHEAQPRTALDDGQATVTATRLHQMLRAESYAVGVTVVKEAVAEWKRQRR